MNMELARRQPRASSGGARFRAVARSAAAAFGREYRRDRSPHRGDRGQSSVTTSIFEISSYIGAALPMNVTTLPKPPRVGLVSLGCPKALVDSERIMTKLR